MVMDHIELPTLGRLIEWLESRDPEEYVDLDAELYSDRGDYAQVAIPSGSARAGALAPFLRRKIGRTMIGYKGGEFDIHEGCAVFVAEYGDMGPRLAIVGDALTTVGDGWDVR